MQLYDQSDGRQQFGSCCTLDDLHDARRVAHLLGIPHYIVNFESRFDEQVVSNFVREYAAGRTPIPCAHCNADLKFAALLERARAFGCDALATGHYARIERTPGGRFRLLRGTDRAKDQTYFLFALTQEQLARTAFPVGHLDKQAVRAHAARLRLAVARKPDSQELCFVPDGNYATLVERRAPELTRPGTVVDADGRVLGTHDGVHRFTIGQRKGLRLSAGVPLYVIALRPDSAEVVVGPREALGRTRLTAAGVNWVSGAPPAPGTRVAAQIRYRHAPAPARVLSANDEHLELEFERPQEAITPGQAAVLYDGDECLGGGWIT
jgi:tRNA-specific 2-thiouridylase